MKCPVCRDKDLMMTDRSGVEIDYCPGCRGVWLDRGELDKIIERASPAVSSPPPQARSEKRHVEHQSRDSRDSRDDYGRSRKKKKSSILSELFDF